MSGDYSRKTFDPKRDFSGVLMQQGRVQLDSDWNELIGIVGRRLRAETTDIIGTGTVPKETPDGFKIAIAADGTLTIGRGRIYVDGLLAENHGKAPLEFDPVLTAMRGTLPMPFNEQPYFPNVATVAPAPVQGGPHLVYLDVWQREVTYLENPDLVEKAIGVDTTTRLQTVWQVRVLQNSANNNLANVTCATPDDQIPSWAAIISPSDARISTDAVGVATATDPCVIPPSGGYRGLENQLYRVEIHDGGTAGKATFKWSRDNASVATSVTTIPSLDTLIVALIGRDNTLRFSIGDWIEITDDWREFAQQPGLMCQIKDVVDATQTITLTNPLPAGMIPTDAQGNTDPTRHTRIKLWNQQGKVTDTNGNLLVDLNAPGSTGLIPVPASGTSIILEDGVQVTFNTPAAGIYHVGDYWSFAARTADASVEKLVQAPPQGIHHHFCRLAMVTFSKLPPSDCRNLWSPDFGNDGCCECSVCVTAASHNQGTLTIQQAIDQVKTTGGTVCLGVGVYFLRETPVTITGAKSLCIRGQGSETVLTYSGPGSAISIDGSSGVTIEKLALLTAPNPKLTSPSVAVHDSSTVTLQRNAIVRAGASEFAPAAIGLSGVLVGVLVRENLLVAPTGIGRTAAAPAGKSDATQAAAAAPAAVLLTADLVVQDNTFECSRRGVSFDGLSFHALQTRLAGNLIGGCSQFGIVMLGWVAAGSGLEVRENELHVSGAGIAIGTDDARIESNNIAALRAGSGTDGIILTPGFDKTGLGRCQVLGNRIVGMAGNGILFQNGIIRSAMLKNNYVEAVGGGGIIMDDTSAAGQLTIENNHLFNLAPLSNDAGTAVIGLRVVNTLRAEIVGNALVNIGLAAAQSPHRAGIQVVNIGSGRIDGNQVLNVGPVGEFLQQAAGIESLGTFGRLDISNNTVRRNETPPAPPASPGTSRWVAVHIQSLTTKDYLAASADLSFAAVDNLIYAFVGNRLFSLPRGREIVGLHGNLLESYGAAPVVSVIASGAFNFSSNRCLLSSADTAALVTPVVQAQVGAAMISANYLEGAAKIPAMQLNLLPQNGPFTVLGNISSGPIHVNGGPLPTAPWGSLNVPAS